MYTDEFATPNQDFDGEFGEARTLRMSLRERPRKTVDRKARSKADELKFLEDFDPETSNREKRKLKRKGSATAKIVNAYDEYGRIRWNGLDICDCLDEKCPGCWYECEQCGSCKCGEQCRRNRKFHYESITFDGKDAQIKNKYCITK